MVAEKHSLAQINHEGDTKVEWNPENEDEVAVARAAWQRLVRDKGYSAFSVKEDGTSGGRLTEFDPQEKRIILVPQMAGGGA